MNNPKFVEKVAEEMWNTAQECALNKERIINTSPWFTVVGDMRGIYLAMASRAIDVITQENPCVLPAEDRPPLILDFDEYKY
jgi:hypothetical protein